MSTGKITLQISGMSCSHCEKSLAKAIQGLNGIQHVALSSATGTAVIEFDNSLVTENEIAKAVADTDIYQVTGVTA
jgi:copper chaperone CopZ